VEFVSEYTVFGPRTHLSKPMSVRMSSWLLLDWRPFSEGSNLRVVNYVNADQLHAESFAYLGVARELKERCERESEVKSVLSSLSSRIMQHVVSEACWGLIFRYRIETKSVRL